MIRYLAVALVGIYFGYTITVFTKDRDERAYLFGAMFVAYLCWLGLKGA